MSKVKISKKGQMYECQAFFPEGYPKKWKYVTNLKSFSDFLTNSHSSWKYFNVYEKGSKQFLKRFYPANLVPKVLGFLLILLTQKFTFNETLIDRESLSIPMKNTFNKATSSTSINGIYYTATIPTPKPLKMEELC